MEAKYTVGGVKTLVDLNIGDFPVYKTSFIIRAPATIRWVVLTQSDLDSGNEIPYKSQRGEIVDEIVGDESENHYLAMEADYETEVTVIMDTVQLQNVPQQEYNAPVPHPYGAPSDHITALHAGGEYHQSPDDDGVDPQLLAMIQKHKTERSNSSKMQTGIIVAIVVLIVGGIYWRHKNRQ